MNKVYDKTIVVLIDATEQNQMRWMCVVGGYQSRDGAWFLKTRDNSIEYKSIKLEIANKDLLSHLTNAIDSAIEREEDRRKERILNELEPQKKWWMFW